MKLHMMALGAALIVAGAPFAVFAQALMGGSMSTPPLPPYQPGCGYSCGPAYQNHHKGSHPQRSTRKKSRDVSH
jgi:hypothetical protein